MRYAAYWLGLLIWATADGDTSPSFFYFGEFENEFAEYFCGRIRRLRKGGK